jgi:hypothetical protein
LHAIHLTLLLLLLYTAEDEWPIRSSRYNADRGPVLINQHRTTRERCDAAAAFAADFGISMPVLVDPVPGEEHGEQQQQQGVEGCADAVMAEAAAAAASPTRDVGQAKVLTGPEGLPVQQQQQQVNGSAADASSGRAAARDAAAAAMAAAAAAASSCRSCAGPDTTTSCSINRSSDRATSSRVIGYGASGPFDAALAPWPLRFYVLDRAGVLLYKADPRECQYDLFELWQWLEDRQQQQQQQQQQGAVVA